MPYGQQTLSRGDIPRGGFLGSIGAALGGAVKGFIKGGPVGAIGGAIGGAVKYNLTDTSGSSGAAMPIGSSPPSTAIARYSGTNETSADELVRLHQVNIAHAQAAGKTIGGTAVMTKQGHARRMKRDGTPYKKPHMQVTNTRALRRALRRAHGFARIAMKTIKIVNPRHKGRFGGWKKRRTR